MRATTLLLLAFWPALSPADAVRDSVGACIRALEKSAAPAASTGADTFERGVALPTACPGLKEQLEASPYSAWLPHEWATDDVRVSQLRELDRLLSEAQSEERPGVAAPDAGRVVGVLKELKEQEAAKERSLWERFTDWLLERSQRQMEQDNPSWLVRLLKNLNFSNAGAEGFASLLLLLVVAGAVIAIFNELRAAGVLSRKRAARPKGGGEATVLAGSTRALDVDAVELRLRPSLLLDLFLERQAARQPEAGDASLTHRELGAAVKLADAEQQSDFTRLASCAERTRYASSDPAERELTDAVAAGRRLLAGFTSA